MGLYINGKIGSVYCDGNIGKIYVGNNLIYQKKSADNYLAFTAGSSSANISFVKNGTLSTTPVIYYSTNKTSWTQYTFGNSISLSANSTIYFKGDNATFSESSSNYIQFTSSTQVSASGDVMSLLDSTFAKTVVPDYAFCNLFYNSPITTAPELGGLTVGKYSYYQMFLWCSSLVVGPVIKATSFDECSCASMLQACGALATMPDLPEATLGVYSYQYMFAYDSSLVTAPAIKSTTSGVGSCIAMFSNCTGLVSGPDIHITNVANYTFNYMFQTCSHLSNVKVRYTGSFSSNQFAYWMSGVPSSGTFYYNGSDTTRGDSAIPTGWTITRF